MTKKDKINKCREILYKYKSNDIIDNIGDIEFLTLILEGHNEWELKKGCGLKHFSTQDATYGTKCFVINRLDGSSTDVSFMKAITNRSKLIEIKTACRTAVKDIINQFREDNVEYGITKCSVTGETLYQGTTHIDHYNLTFDELFNIWFKQYDENFLFKLINQTSDNSMETYFTNDKINEDFIHFHNKNTTLRAVTKTANLSLLKKK